jgi:AcrR family transcriptional regulator
MNRRLLTFREQYTGTGRRPPRAEAIVADAIQLIAEKGYAEFTLRKVAARNGIKLASLQYHFKTKEALLNAVLEQILHDFEKRFNEEAFELVASFEPKRLLDFSIGFISKDMQRADLSNFFFQLWAMSCHDPSAARIQEKIYALYHKSFSRLIKLLNPQLSAAERNIRSVVIISMLEGLMLFISEGKSHKKHAAKIVNQVKKEALRIAIA